MALSGTQRGTGSDTVSSTTATVTPSGNLAASSWAVLVIACDNSETNGVAHTTFTVTDTKSNTWTRRISPLQDPGSASQGVEGAIFTTAQNGGALTTGDTITITWGVNTTANTAVLWEVTTSGTISYVTGGVGSGSSTTTPTVTTGSITSGDMVIGGLFVESGTAVVTGDSDTSNGNWSAAHNIQAGSGTTGMLTSSQYKTTTGTATQTYNPTLDIAADCIAGYIVLTESGGGGGGSTARSWAVIVG